MTLVSILCVISVSTNYIFEIHDHVYEEKQTKTRHLVETVYGVLEYFNAQEKTGGLNRKEAQTAALGLIRQLRYENMEYFWINDMQPTMIMHPYKPQLDGKDLSNVKDPAGKRLFVEFVDKVRQEGAGYVNYMWPKPGRNDPVSKTSYVKGFHPWGWIIGSGIYLDDLEATFAEHWQGSF